MDSSELARLFDLLCCYEPPYRVGRSVGRTLYRFPGGDDDIVGMMDTREGAELVILAIRYAREKLVDGTP